MVARNPTNIEIKKMNDNTRIQTVPQNAKALQAELSLDTRRG